MLFKKALLLIQGISIVTFLFLFTVDRLLLSSFNIFVAFVFVIGFSWLSPDMKNRTNRIFILTLPILYLTLLSFTADFLDPELYKFLSFILLCVYLIFQRLDNFRVFILLALAYTFTYGIYVYIPQWTKKFEKKVVFEIRDDIEDEDQAEVPISINLRDFNFLNSDNELIKLENSANYYVVETWAEWCVPCMRAIEEMAPYFERNKESFNHVLVYSDKRFSKLKNPNRIWSFLENVDKSKILVDEKRSLSEAVNTYALPLFIVFDKHGNFVEFIEGYRGEEYLKNALDKYIE